MSYHVWNTVLRAQKRDVMSWTHLLRSQLTQQHPHGEGLHDPPGRSSGPISHYLPSSCAKNPGSALSSPCSFKSPCPLPGMSFPWLISSVHPLGVPSIHEGIGSPHLPVSPLYLPLSFCLDHTVLQLLLHTCFSPPRLWEPQSRDYIFSVFPETSQWTRLITTAKALLEFLFFLHPLCHHCDPSHWPSPPERMPCLPASPFTFPWSLLPSIVRMILKSIKQIVL